MTLIQYIPEKDVLKKARSLIKKTKHSLHLTMLLQEELLTISPGYISLLKNKSKEGTKIKRIGFGSSYEYNSMKRKMGHRLSTNFLFLHCENVQQFQRLLISDKKEMLYAVYHNGKRMVFTTCFEPLIEGFLKYFNSIFDSIPSGNKL